MPFRMHPQVERIVRTILYTIGWWGILFVFSFVGGLESVVPGETAPLWAYMSEGVAATAIPIIGILMAKRLREARKRGSWNPFQGTLDFILFVTPFLVGLILVVALWEFG